MVTVISASTAVRRLAAVKRRVFQGFGAQGRAPDVQQGRACSPEASCVMSGIPTGGLTRLWRENKFFPDKILLKLVGRVGRLIIACGKYGLSAAPQYDVGLPPPERRLFFAPTNPGISLRRAVRHQASHCPGEQELVE